MNPYTRLLDHVESFISSEDEQAIHKDLLLWLSNASVRWQTSGKTSLANEQTFVFQATVPPDTREVLFRRWGSHAEIAFRPFTTAVWGPPYDGEYRH